MVPSLIPGLLPRLLPSCLLLTGRSSSSYLQILQHGIEKLVKMETNSRP